MTQPTEGISRSLNNEDGGLHHSRKTLEQNQTNTAVEACFELVEHIAQVLGYEQAFTSEIDIDVSNEISRAFVQVFNYLWKRDNGDDEVKGNANSTHTVSDIGKSYKGSGFNFEIATPVMNLLTIFELQFNEVCTGVTRAPRMTNSPNQDYQFYINDFGLGSEHIPLLVGITYPPERRDSLMSFMGPLALAIIAVNETEEKREKPLKAFRNSIHMIPMASTICHFIRTYPKEKLLSMLRALGDVLNLYAIRAIRFTAMPLIFVHYLYKKKGSDLSEWDISLIQKYMAEVQFKIRTKASEDQVKQMIFHAMHGTACYNFKLLGQVTNQAVWSTREEIDKRSNEMEVLTVTPIKEIYEYAGKRIAVRAEIVRRIHSFGTTQRYCSAMRKLTFFEAFSSRKVVYSQHPRNIVSVLEKMKKDFSDPAKKDELEKLSTIQWYYFETDIKVNLDVSKEGVSYYGEQRF